MAVGAGGVDQVLAIRVPIRAPVDVGVVGELVFLAGSGDLAGGIERQVGGENLEQVVGFSIGAIDQAFAVGGEKRAAVVAGGGGDADRGFLVRAVGFHDVDVGVFRAAAGEADEFAIGRE